MAWIQSRVREGRALVQAQAESDSADRELNRELRQLEAAGVALDAVGARLERERATWAAAWAPLEAQLEASARDQAELALALSDHAARGAELERAPREGRVVRLEAWGSPRTDLMALLACALIACLSTSRALAKNAR